MTELTSPALPLFTLAGIRRGFLKAQPMAPGIVAYGLLFGILASGAGFSLAEAVLTSAFVYSGSAQIALVQSWSATPPLLAMVSAVLLINARYLLYSASLRPWMGGLPPGAVYPTLFFLGDGNWALSMREQARGERDAGFVLGSGVAMFLPWTGGTAFGHAGGSLIGDPRLLGLDFMLPAFTAALALGLWRGRADLAGALAALVVALAAVPFIPAGWVIVLAGLAAGLVAWLRFKPA